jgi:hypothetical protein
MHAYRYRSWLGRRVTVSTWCATTWHAGCLSPADHTNGGYGLYDAQAHLRALVAATRRHAAERHNESV